MRAVVCRQWGDIDDLRVEELPPPDLPAGHVRIAVEACGINFADLLLVRGQYQEEPAFPFAPGMEAAGRVIEVAADVDDVAVGERALAFLDRHGGYAEEAVTRAVDVARIPEGMDAATAAAFPVVYATAHLALAHRARLQPGEVLLVHGASGGVGLTAVEVGKALGATVIASASSADKLEVARQHGADHLLNYAQEDIRDRVLALTDGADVVFDPVGGDAFTASLRCIRPGGRILVIGFASGAVPQIPANHLLVKDASALGLSLGQLRRNRPDVVREAVRECLDWWAQGRLRPLVSQVLPLEEFATGMRLLGDRRATGKVVLRVRDEVAR